ncbi:MAG TPA: hypothetical protein VNV66_04755 [Pilimelia sp.]|nr:hypothetical protein [Pilimelia sp.]
MIGTVEDLIAEALFVSELQPSARPSCPEIQSAVTRTVLRLGSDGCAAAVAAAFGDYPETAVPRMRWARDAIRHAYPAITAPRLTPTR